MEKTFLKIEIVLCEDGTKTTTKEYKASIKEFYDNQDLKKADQTIIESMEYLEQIRLEKILKEVK